ncbi:hypothetical protein TruAng_009741 [Truncatella angustata]|nr:hypothetical protein TruAng_009741 [Truncatella angustata]
MGAERAASDCNYGGPGLLDIHPSFDLALYHMHPPTALFDDALQYGNSIDNIFNSLYDNFTLSTCSTSSTSSGTPENVAVEHDDADDETSPMMDLSLEMRIDSLLMPTKKDGVDAQPHQLPPELLELLSSTYFYTCQSTVRLFDDQARLSSLMQQSSWDSLALRHAVCTHAVPHCPQFSAWAASNMEENVSGSDYKGFFYRLARDALDKCFLEDKSSRPTLQALQAIVLIGHHELQQGEFARAWLTANRLHWITQTLQLRNLGSPDQVPCVDDEQLEDKRKALWAANGLACFFMGGSTLIDPGTIEEITTSLPQTHTETLLLPGVTIGDVFRNAAPRPLSVEEALLAARMLAPRIAAHVKTTEPITGSPDQQQYNFWINHHRLEETLRYLVNFILSDPVPEANVKVLLNLLVKALTIILHEAVLRKIRACSHQGQKASDQVRVNEHALLQRALEVAAAVQTSVLPTDAATNLTTCWIVYIALQSLLRHQRRTSAQRSDQLTAASSCTVGGDAGAYEPGNAADLEGALVMDSFDALHSTLVRWSEKSPVADFYLEQVRVESGIADSAIDKRIIGLVDFATLSRS